MRVALYTYAWQLLVQDGLVRRRPSRMLSGIRVFWTLLVAVIVYRVICARDNA